MAKTISEKLEYKEHDQIEPHLSKLLDILNSIIFYIENNVERSDKSVVHVNILRYLSRQLNIYKQHWNISSEVSAFVCRNFFETSILLQYIHCSDENMKSYIVARATDEKTILKRLSEMKTETDKSIQRKKLENRIKELDSFLTKHNFDSLESSVKVFDKFEQLAKSVGREDEYISFYRMYSKYIHPTSWVVNGDQNSSHEFTFKNIFLIQLQEYLGHIVLQFQDVYCKDFLSSFK